MDDRQPSEARRHRRGQQLGPTGTAEEGVQVYGKPSKSNHTALYLDRDGKVQTVHYRMPEAAKPKGAGAGESTASNDDRDTIASPTFAPMSPRRAMT